MSDGSESVHPAEASEKIVSHPINPVVFIFISDLIGWFMPILKAEKYNKKGVRIVFWSYPAFRSWRTSKLDKNNNPTPIELITYEAQADAGPR